MSKSQQFCAAALRQSYRVYVRIAPQHVGFFRFLLEAEDNLGYMSVVDRHAAVLKVVCTSYQELALLDYLVSMQETLPFWILPRPHYSV